MTNRFLPLISTLVVVACAANTRPTLTPDRMAELWQEPAGLERRDLLHGPGGRGLAPSADARFTLITADDKGFSPGYDVTDEQGRRWSVKLGPEARTEVVVSRLVWAVGYHQPAVYYLPQWTLVDNGKTRLEAPARFRLEPESQKAVDSWSWRSNPFLETRPFAGLFVLMVMVNNWDVKSPQNVIYEVDGSGPRHRYVVKDLGASLGKTNWLFPGNRDDVEGFLHEPFIKRVEGNRVVFAYKGAWREPQLTAMVAPDDVRWMCGLLTRLSRGQWLEAFQAGGYDEVEAGPFIRRLQEKVAEGLSLE